VFARKILTNSIAAPVDLSVTRPWIVDLPAGLVVATAPIAKIKYNRRDSIALNLIPCWWLIVVTSNAGRSL
jgi:hypothetical protein